MTLTELCEDWLSDLRSAGKSRGTLVAYRQGVSSYLAHSDSLDRHSVRQWLASLDGAT